MARADFLAGVVLLFASLIAVFVVIPDQIDAASTDGMSPDLLPLTLVSLIGFFSLLLIAGRLFGNAADSENPISMHDAKSAGLIAAIVAGAILLMQTIGLIAAGAVLIAGLSWIMGERHLLILAVVSLVPCAAVMVLASAVLRISLP